MVNDGNHQEGSLLPLKKMGGGGEWGANHDHHKVDLFSSEPPISFMQILFSTNKTNRFSNNL